MPEYVFETTKGEEVVLLMDVDEAPIVGDSIRYKGRKLTRVFTLSQIKVRRDIAAKQWSLPPKHLEETPGIKEWDTDGSPVITSRKQAKEVEAASGGRWVHDD